MHFPYSRCITAQHIDSFQHTGRVDKGDLARVRGRASKQAMPKKHRLKLVNKGRVKESTAGKGTTTGKDTAASERKVKGTAAGKVTTAGKDTAAGEAPGDWEYWYSKKHLDRSAEYAP